MAGVSKDKRASTSVLTRPGTDLQDLDAETHQHLVDQLVQRLALVHADGVGQQRRVVGQLHRLQDQRRIGGGVARRKGRELPEIAGVGDDDGVLLELFELVHALRPRG
jgi:hypothetical protein